MRKRWSAAGISPPNSLMIAASSLASSFSVRQNGDSTARARSGSPSATSERARMIMPSAVCGRVPPNACTTSLGAGLSRSMALSLLRRSAAMPGQPGNACAAAAISPLGTSAPPCSAIAQVRMCRSSALPDRLSRTARARTTSLADSASRPLFSLAISADVKGIWSALESGCVWIAPVIALSRLPLIAACGRAFGTGA